MKNISQLLTDRDILTLLQSLHRVPARKRINVAKGRARFNKEVRDLSLYKTQPVSNSFLAGLMVWIKNHIPVGKTRKEVNMMWMKFSIVTLVIIMVLGGTVTAVQAAEASLPGQLMYPLKIVVEDIQGIAANPVDQVQVSIQRLEKRIQEILRLREQNKEVPESAYQRVEQQLELTLRYITGLTDDELVSGLINVQSRLMVQDRLLQELQNQGQRNDDAVLDRLRTMLQTRSQLMEDGINDPQHLKIQLRDRDRDRDSMTGDANSPVNNQGTGTSVGPGSAVNSPTPGAYGPGPGPAENTPTAGAYGPGPKPIEITATPGGYGPGPGPVENTLTPCPYAPGPIENTPTPGAYGPGPGPIENTTTPGAYGPGATPTLIGTGSGNKP